MTECAHKWIVVNDWIGDPNVIGGTQDCSFWRCELCDDETECEPEVWADDAELEEAEARCRNLGIDP